MAIPAPVPAEEVRRVILEKRLSMRQFAKHFGVHIVTVYAWRRHGIVFRPGLSRVRPEAWDAFALNADSKTGSPLVPILPGEVTIAPSLARLPAPRTRLSIVLPRGRAALGGFSTLPANELARMCGVKPSTARRWRQTGKAPASIVTLLEFFHHGPLKMISTAWAEWHIRDGKLGTPDGQEYTPGEVWAIPILHQHIASLEVTVRQLHDELARIREFRMVNSITENDHQLPTRRRVSNGYEKG